MPDMPPDSRGRPQDLQREVEAKIGEIEQRLADLERTLAERARRALEGQVPEAEGLPLPPSDDKDSNPN